MLSNVARIKDASQLLNMVYIHAIGSQSIFPSYFLNVTDNVLKNCKMQIKLDFGENLSKTRVIKKRHYSLIEQAFIIEDCVKIV